MYEKFRRAIMISDGGEVEGSYENTLCCGQ